MLILLRCSTYFLSALASSAWVLQELHPSTLGNSHCRKSSVVNNKMSEGTILVCHFTFRVTGFQIWAQHHIFMAYKENSKRSTPDKLQIHIYSLVNKTVLSRETEVHLMIQELVQPSLDNLKKSFFVWLSHCCRRILSHSSIQPRFSSPMVWFYAQLSQGPAKVFRNLRRSHQWMGFFLFFSISFTGLLLCFTSLSVHDPTLTFDSRILWSWIPWLQNKPKSPSLHHRAWQ